MKTKNKKILSVKSDKTNSGQILIRFNTKSEVDKFNDFKKTIAPKLKKKNMSLNQFLKKSLFEIINNYLDKDYLDKNRISIKNAVEKTLDQLIIPRIYGIVKEVSSKQNVEQIIANQKLNFLIYELGRGGHIDGTTDILDIRDRVINKTWVNRLYQDQYHKDTYSKDKEGYKFDKKDYEND